MLDFVLKIKSWSGVGADYRMVKVANQRELKALSIARLRLIPWLGGLRVIHNAAA